MTNQPLFVSQNINALALFFGFLCEKHCLCSCCLLRRRGAQLLISMQSLLRSSSVERTPPLQLRSRLCLACSEGEKLNKQIDILLQVVFPHPTGVLLLAQKSNHAPFLIRIFPWIFHHMDENSLRGRHKGSLIPGFWLDLISYHHSLHSLVSGHTRLLAILGTHRDALTSEP